MIEQKKEIAALAAQCNEKPKAFVEQCKKKYDVKVAAKILLFERSLLVENVTEVIGSKKFGDFLKEFLKL